MGAHPGHQGQQLTKDSSQHLGGSEADGGMENGAMSTAHPSNNSRANSFNGPISSNIKVAGLPNSTTTYTHDNIRQSTRHPTTQTKVLPLIFQGQHQPRVWGHKSICCTILSVSQGPNLFGYIILYSKAEIFLIQRRNAIMSNVIQTIFCLETIKSNESF